jgi:cephalosporin hydroxylase
MSETVMADRRASVLSWFRQGAEGTQKIAEDIARYRTIIARTRPAVVVETGTGSGHFALFLAMLGCRVVTVDIDPWPSFTTVQAWGDRVTQITGDSADPVVVEAVRRVVGYAEPVLVSLDSDHSAGHVRAEMEAYAPLVTPGSHMVVEDTILDWLPPDNEVRSRYSGTPMEAVLGFLAMYDGRWQVDAELEGMFLATQHPAGWLRRLE